MTWAELALSFLEASLGGYRMWCGERITAATLFLFAIMIAPCNMCALYLKITQFGSARYWFHALSASATTLFVFGAVDIAMRTDCTVKPFGLEDALPLGIVGVYILTFSLLKNAWLEKIKSLETENGTNTNNTTTENISV
jgi:hypothetical protein